MVDDAAQKIWIVTGETKKVSIPKGAKSSEDVGGLLSDLSEFDNIPEVGVEVVESVQPVEVDKLKREMKAFLLAMREILAEAEAPNSKMQLEEVDLSVEINGEGQVRLLGIGGKAGGKGAMTLKFKRRA